MFKQAFEKYAKEGKIAVLFSGKEVKIDKVFCSGVTYVDKKTNAVIYAGMGDICYCKDAEEQAPEATTPEAAAPTTPEATSEQPKGLADPPAGSPVEPPKELLQTLAESAFEEYLASKQEPELNDLLRKHYEENKAKYASEQPAAPATLAPAVVSPLQVQVGGSHYKDCKIQPIEYIMANKLSFAEGCIVKYITRHQAKDGAQDIKKIMQYCRFILKFEYGVSDEEIGKC
jgi:pyruvate/2-oxoglutarate dehydrogenase complex dihydrolipoamide acyltransferase (E2) component